MLHDAPNISYDEPDASFDLHFCLMRSYPTGRVVVLHQNMDNRGHDEIVSGGDDTTKSSCSESCLQRYRVIYRAERLPAVL